MLSARAAFGACLCVAVARAVLPDGELEVSGGPGSAYVAPGFFGRAHCLEGEAEVVLKLFF